MAAAAKDNRYEYFTAGESTLETKSPLAAYIDRTNVIDKVRERGVWVGVSLLGCL